MPDKTCVRCNKTLPFSFFSRDKSRPDGYFPYCKPCKTQSNKECNLDPEKDKARKQKHYLANIERYRADAKRPDRVAAQRARHQIRQSTNAEFRERARLRAAAHYQSVPIEKQRANRQAWKGANLEKAKRATRASHLRKAYGLTIEQYEEMVRAQNGVCLICDQPPRGKYKNLAVDHCHVTGNVRGLLCYNCNFALGNFQDSVECLLKAIEYLKTHS